MTVNRRVIFFHSVTGSINDFESLGRRSYLLERTKSNIMNRIYKIYDFILNNKQRKFGLLHYIIKKMIKNIL